VARRSGFVSKSPPSQSGFAVSFAVLLATSLPSPDRQGGDSMLTFSLRQATRATRQALAVKPGRGACWNHAIKLV
jgi:hypothetical protein